MRSVGLQLIRFAAILPAVLVGSDCTDATGPREGPPPEVPAVRFAVGAANTCLVLDSGQVRCWGHNIAGDFQAPDGGQFRAVSVSAHVCALTTEGRALCWGPNRDGEIGDGTRRSRALPTHVATERRFAFLHAGGGNTCGIDGNGRAFCWGRNNTGAVGIGRITDPLLRPVAVESTLRFQAISNGGSVYCGLNVSGKVFCWGELAGSFGGDFSAPGSCDEAFFNFFQGEGCLTPTAVDSELRFTQISGHGATDCGITEEGEAFCWGQGHRGTLGNGEFGRGVHSIQPTRVLLDARFTAVAAGASHTCGIADQATYCWGNNFAGQLGQGDEGGRGGIAIGSVPLRVDGAPPFVELGAGTAHTCGLTSDDEVWCWGRGPIDSSVPVRLSPDAAPSG